MLQSRTTRSVLRCIADYWGGEDQTHCLNAPPVILRVSCPSNLHLPPTDSAGTVLSAGYCYDVTCSVVCVSVSVFCTLVNPAKTDEAIEMLFGVQTREDPGNHHELDGSHISATW